MFNLDLSQDPTKKSETESDSKSFQITSVSCDSISESQASFFDQIKTDSSQSDQMIETQLFSDKFGFDLDTTHLLNMEVEVEMP